MTRPRELPAERPGVTRQFKLRQADGTELVLYGTKSYDRGEVRELILTCNKQGSLERGLLHVLGVTASLALQGGVPLTKLIDKWRGIEFEPQGLTGNPEIPMVKSIVDYLAKWLEKETVEDNRRQDG